MIYIWIQRNFLSSAISTPRWRAVGDCLLLWVRKYLHWCRPRTFKVSINQLHKLNLNPALPSGWRGAVYPLLRLFSESFYCSLLQSFVVNVHFSVVLSFHLVMKMHTLCETVPKQWGTAKCFVTSHSQWPQWHSICRRLLFLTPGAHELQILVVTQESVLELVSCAKRPERLSAVCPAHSAEAWLPSQNWCLRSALQSLRGCLLNIMQ